MNNLVIIKNNEPTTTSLIVSQQLNRSHDSITNLIEKYEKSFKMFGVLVFEMLKPKKGSKGGRPLKVYNINEQQLMFLLMNMKVLKKDGDLVLSFKEEITKEFFRMRKALLQISLQQKNQEWIEIRQKGKESRKEFTDAIKELQVLHAKKYPDSTYTKEPNRLYSNITRMIDKALFDIQVTVKNKRNYMTKQQLTYLDVAEIKMQEIIQKCIDENRDAKETYIILQAEIEPYAKFIGKTPIIDMLTNKQLSMFEGDIN